MFQSLKEKYISEWINQERITYSYDENNSLLTELTEIWQNQWFPEYLKTFTYDINKNIATGKSEIMENINWIPFLNYFDFEFKNNTYFSIYDVYRFEATYSQYVSSPIIKNAHTEIIISPNPTTNYIKIENAKSTILNIMIQMDKS